MLVGHLNSGENPGKAFEAPFKSQKLTSKPTITFISLYSCMTQTLMFDGLDMTGKTISVSANYSDSDDESNMLHNNMS
jgi:hypothetical protein